MADGGCVPEVDEQGSSHSYTAMTRSVVENTRRPRSILSMHGFHEKIRLVEQLALTRSFDAGVVHQTRSRRDRADAPARSELPNEHVDRVCERRNTVFVKIAGQ